MNRLFHGAAELARRTPGPGVRIPAHHHHIRDRQSALERTRALKARGVPFLFMTGYGSASIDSRFADVPVLQKPIEAKTLEDMLLDRNMHFNLRRDNDMEPVQRQAV